MSGPTLHLPFLSSNEQACLAEVYNGVARNFHTVEDFFVCVLDNSRTACKSYHQKLRHHTYAESEWEMRDEYRGAVRSVSFRSPVTGSPIGPDETAVREQQHFFVDTHAQPHATVNTPTKIGVMEVRTTAVDIPYADHFVVVTRWMIEPLQGAGLKLTFYAGANFVKNTMWKGKIESGAKNSAKSGFNLWVDCLNQLNPAAVLQAGATTNVFPSRVSRLLFATSHHTFADQDSSEVFLDSGSTTTEEGSESAAFMDDTIPQLVSDAEDEGGEQKASKPHIGMPVPQWAESREPLSQTSDLDGFATFTQTFKTDGELISDTADKATRELFRGSSRLRSKLGRLLPSLKTLSRRRPPPSHTHMTAREPERLDSSRELLDPAAVVPAEIPDAASNSVLAETGQTPSAEAPTPQVDASVPQIESASPIESDLYECVFYQQKLGIRLKFIDGYPIVAAVDPVDPDETSLDLNPEPSRPSISTETSRMSIFSAAPGETSQSAPTPWTMRQQEVEATAELSPPPLETSLSTSSDSASQTPLSKIVVQSTQLFGEGVKRIWKAVLPSETSQPDSLEVFLRDLRSKFSISEGAVSVKYFDADVNAMVQLEPEVWDDFMSMAVKTIEVEVSNTADEEVESGEKEADVAVDSPATGNMSMSFNKLKETMKKYTLRMTSGSDKDVAKEDPASTEPIAVDDDKTMAEQPLAPPKADVVLTQEFEVEDRGPEVGSVILSINGVRVKGLDMDHVLSLLKQKTRPLVVEFRANAQLSLMAGLEAKNTSNRVRIHYTTFQAKYGHKLNTRTRTRVEKFIKDYLSCDWLRAQAENNGTPGVSMCSLYPWILNEMCKQGLFDNSTVQGGGLPDMGEQQLDDVREHIERFLMNSCFTHSVNSFPGGDTEDLALTYKLASINFLTPTCYGLGISTEAENAVLTGEQWSLATTEFCKSFTLRTPTDILRRLKVSVRMVAHAVEALLDAVKAHKKNALNPQDAVQPPRERTNIPKRARQKKAAKTASVVGVDDLLPALTWVIVQGNPPRLARMLWFVSEFKNPDLTGMGEEQYCLAQVMSAVEFAKNLTARDVEMTPLAFSQGLARFELTEKLFVACMRGDVPACRDLIARGADANGLTQDQRDSPVSLALKYRQKNVLQMLLDNPNTLIDIRLSPYFGDPRMITPLMLGSMVGDKESVLILLSKGADRYAADSEGNTAASVAMLGGHLEVVKILLADPDYITLSEACSSGNAALVDGLLLQGILPNQRHENGSCTPLIASAYMGHMHILERLLKHPQIDVNFRNVHGETALMFSVQATDRATADTQVAVALLLLKHGADRYLKDNQRRTAVQWAEQWGSPRLVNILKHDPSRLKIYECARDRNMDAVTALLEQGVDPNLACPSKGYTALIASVFNDDLVLMDMLLNHPRTDPNKRGRGGMTPLHYAAQSAIPSIVGRLLAAGADRALRDERGRLPRDLVESKTTESKAADAKANERNTFVLDILRYSPHQVSICLAAMHGDTRVISALIAQGVGVNTRQKHRSAKGWHHERYTPLIAAVAHDQFDTARMLLHQKGIDVNLANLLGQTPLTYAAARGSERLVLMLLKFGANRYIPDKDGQAPVVWAKQRGHSKIAYILQADPAKITIHDSIRDNKMEEVVALFKQGIDVNVQRTRHGPLPPPGLASMGVYIEGETPLMACARFGRSEIMKMIFRAPDLQVDMIDAAGRTALFHAAVAGNEEGVLMLLRKGANRRHLDYTRKTVIDLALDMHHLQVAAILQTDPARVSIHDSCADGRITVVGALLKQGVDINFHDMRSEARGETPLIIAARHKRIELVKFLLAQPDVDVDGTDADGKTALMEAAGQGALDITAELLGKGCNRDVSDRRGLTAEHWAAKYGHLNLILFMGQQIFR